MKEIWVVIEDCHEDVSCWSTKEKAYEEARNIIMMNPYHPDDGHKITREEIKDQDIEDGSYYVYVYKAPLNKSWV